MQAVAFLLRSKLVLSSKCNLMILKQETPFGHEPLQSTNSLGKNPVYYLSKIIVEEQSLSDSLKGKLIHLTKSGLHSLHLFTLSTTEVKLN